MGALTAYGALQRNILWIYRPIYQDEKPSLE